MKSLLPQGAYAPHVHPRLRKRLARCTLDCGSKTSESPALRGFVGGPRALATAALYLVLLSNGFPYSKIRLKKFDFSPIDTPANIAKKLPSQRCSQPFLIAFSTSRTNGPRSLLRAKAGTHSAFGKRSHTRAHTAKQGHSLPRPQCGFVLPAKSLLFHRAFIYIHFPVLYEPSTPAEEKNPAELPPQRCSKPLFIAFFNFSHKRPTLAFTAESGYTLAFANRIAHSGLHGETGVFWMGALLLPSERSTRFGNPAWPGFKTANFAAFGSWSETLLKNAESLRSSDALMRVAVPKASRPRWAA